MKDTTAIKDEAPGSAPWLVLKTRSRHEDVVETSLQQKRIDAYLPRRNVLRQWKGKRRVVSLPLFPGYVFVRPTADQFDNIRYIRGSCGLILSGSRPATLCDGDLDAVKILVNSGAELRVDPQLTPGQRVKIASGPFAGACGELVRVKRHDRLVINVHLLASSVSVEVESDAITML